VIFDREVTPVEGNVALYDERFAAYRQIHPALRGLDPRP
jgi:hypothetical protein